MEINQSNEPNENISDYIKDFSEDEVYVDCLFQQARMAYTDKQIASIYKEWIQNH